MDPKSEQIKFSVPEQQCLLFLRPSTASVWRLLVLEKRRGVLKLQGIKEIWNEVRNFPDKIFHGKVIPKSLEKWGFVSKMQGLI